MATKSRRHSADLTARILEEPHRFGFFQLVRLVEKEALRQDESKNQLGDSGSPTRDPVFFETSPELVFHPAAVSRVTRVAADQQLRMTVNLPALTGASGVLPQHYSELILQRLRRKDKALKAFLDHFNHRYLSLFYRAWKKHRPALTFESEQVSQSRYVKDWYGEAIRALVGLSGRSVHFHTDDGVWMNYPGTASHRRCNEYTLKNVLYHHFGLEVRIRQFKGKWQRLSPDVVTRMAGAMTLGMNNALGQNAILGSRCWVMQNLFEIEILNFRQQDFQDFAPGSEKLSALYRFIKQRVGIEMDFDLSLMVPEDLLDTAQTRNMRPIHQLGWNTRLHKAHPTDKKIKIRLSSQAMQARSRERNPSHS